MSGFDQRLGTDWTKARCGLDQGQVRIGPRLGTEWTWRSAVPRVISLSTIEVTVDHGDESAD
eukprot:558358-Rhodomonas_salina.1